MRVRPGIRVLSGALRHAIYDEQTKRCLPLAETDLRILLGLASGRPAGPRQLHLASGHYWQRVAELRRRGWLEPGAPVAADLSIPTATALGLPERLSQVWFEVTRSCNLRCHHCYANSGPEVSREGELGLEQWRTIVDKVLDYGALKITFIGGEPLVRRDLVVALIEHIRSRSQEVEISVFSNLTLLLRRPELVETFRALKVNVGTSLYGMDAETHDRMTTGPGSWARTVEAIRALRAEGIGVFGGIYLELAGEVDVEAVSRWAEAIGLSRCTVEPVSAVGRGVAIATRSQGRLNQLPKNKRFDFASPERNASVHNCYWDKPLISPDGTVRACVMEREASLGDALRSPLEQIFSGEAFWRFAALTKDRVEGCQVCEFRYGCHDCRPEAQGTSGNLYQKPDCGYDPRLPIGEPLP